MYLLSLDGGEMQIPVGVTTIPLFPNLVKESVSTLVSLHKMVKEGMLQPIGEWHAFQHAFKIRTEDREFIQMFMLELEKEFPDTVQWYETDGRKLFELRGISGGVTTSLVCYLVSKF